MEITHKMEALDKIKYIKRFGKMKQYEIAKRLGLSSKTISLWATGKAKPKYEFEQLLDNLYEEVLLGNKKKTQVQLIIEKAQARDADTVSFHLTSKKERLYYEAKLFIQEMERTNDARIYLLPMKDNTDDEWYKVAGRSLLFYKYYLAPRLGREVNIQVDTDRYLKFKYGVGAVRWGKRLIEDVLKLGYEAKTIDYGIIIVELGKTYTKAEIREFIKMSESDRVKAQRMVKPVRNYPKLIAEINELNRLLPQKVKKMAEVYRGIYGPELLRPAMELVKIYHRMANGRMNSHDAKLEMLERTDDLAAMLTVLDENNFIPMAARTRMGENIVKIRLEIEEAL